MTGISLRPGSFVRRVACLSVGVALACAPLDAPGGAVGDRSLISEAEIADWRRSGVSDLQELVEKARPRWLRGARTRSVSTPSRILVYQGNTNLGGIDQLRSIPVQSVREIRWLTSAEAGMLPGAGSAHVEGAILITPAGGT